MMKRRPWTFEPPRFGEEPRWGLRLRGRWMFLDAVLADPESLDDSVRPSDLNKGEK
jgi:hypothetical protein